MELSKYFTRRTRDNGEQFTILTDDAPAWLMNAVRDAHDDELPNDWRYRMCELIISELDDAELDMDDDNLELADAIADLLTEIYNADLLAWLAGNLNRVAAVDEAVIEDDWDASNGIMRAIMVGQYNTIRDMAARLINAIVENADADGDAS